jgi:hypothetical protein
VQISAVVYAIPLFELEAGRRPATSLILLNPVIDCGLNPGDGFYVPTWHNEFTQPTIYNLLELALTPPT